ncbi:hypothetical protein VCRA2113O202_20266 [Vibrio crassostreae]|nr:hypothetical protein VCRA2113O202_20266 [Vibrio crassostreae]CAK2008784.1 hypothetical protein VCRA2113O193_20276 [Vibrio crassostreae]CAK2793949.1 hypothetical protein VCRA2113O205_20277 [Vibrio crassostreae]
MASVGLKQVNVVGMMLSQSSNVLLRFGIELNVGQLASFTFTNNKSVLMNVFKSNR